VWLVVEPVLYICMDFLWGILLLGARSDGYNVRRDRFVVPRPKS
jgi:hypothetical protein